MRFDFDGHNVLVLGYSGLDKEVVKLLAWSGEGNIVGKVTLAEDARPIWPWVLHAHAGNRTLLEPLRRVPEAFKPVEEDAAWFFQDARAHTHLRRARHRHAPRRTLSPPLARRATPRRAPARPRSTHQRPLHHPQITRRQECGTSRPHVLTRRNVRSYSFGDSEVGSPCKSAHSAHLARARRSSRLTPRLKRCPARATITLTLTF